MEKLSLDIVLIFFVNSIFCFMLGARVSNMFNVARKRLETILLLKCVKKLDEKSSLSGKSIKDMSLEELSIKLTEQIESLKYD